ncbi:MAG: M48 family metallopeptidase [Alphaproteobacteria bacterium]|nr:M48 family metallopeptidase [Alphaproteobacteria bacterium]
MTTQPLSLSKALRNAALGLFAATAVMAAITPAFAAAGIRDAEIERLLRKFSDPIFKAGGLDPKAVNLYVINDPSLNAFVAGGQNVFIHTGMIMTLDTPNELKGVIAHEAGHITGGHLARGPEAYAKAEIPMLVGMLAGVAAIAAGVPDLGMALLIGSQSVAQREVLAYSRTQESAADQAGAKFMNATGQSPVGMMKVFDRFADQEIMSGYRQDPFVRSHPLSRDRVSNLQNLAAESPFKDVKDSAADLAQYELMRAKLRGFIEKPEVVLRRYPVSDRSAPARYARAAAFFRSAQLDRALPEIDSLIAEKPTYAYYWELKGQILLESSRAKEAVAPYRKSVELAPDEPLIRASLGAALLATEDKTLIAEAKKHLKAALKDEPDNGMAWYYLSLAYGETGDEGLAALATAERYYTLGGYGPAVNFAQRAAAKLKEGTNDWQRANDIIGIAQAEAAKRER